ncbi:hypothetical protein L6164_020762 [Bauhinia variegata]|uniref:Uncharacterized protein n=1 Tax=Bauhinia variegata TaxID=167791 RepID=A0ACB9MWA8_BAUVA|nr:hypothetical protein L6164_020762 [Bauhinia variegata]
MSDYEDLNFKSNTSQAMITGRKGKEKEQEIIIKTKWLYLHAQAYFEINDKYGEFHRPRTNRLNGIRTKFPHKSSSTCALLCDMRKGERERERGKKGQHASARDSTKFSCLISGARK